MPNALRLGGMVTSRLALSVASAFALSVSAPGGWAEQEQGHDEDLIVTKAGSARLLSLRDWPVKRTKGVLRPVPLEEYLSLKFGQVRDQLSAVDKRFEGLEQRFRQLEEDQRLLRQRLETLGEPAGVSEPPADDPSSAP